MNEEQFEMTIDTLQTKMYDRSLLRKLIVYLKPYKIYIFVSFLLLLLITAAELTIPLILKTAIDEHIVPSRKIVVFNDRQSFESFTERYDDVQFTPYIHENSFFVVFSADNLIFFDRDEIQELEERGSFEPDVYFLIQNTAENTSILQNNQYYILSDKYLAVSQQTMDGLDKEEISILRKESKSRLFFYGAIFLLIIIARLIFHYYQVYITNYASQKAMFDLRRDAFVHLEKMPLSFFDKNPVGRLVTRVTTDIRALDELLSQGLVTMLQDIMILIGIVIIMLFLNWKMALISFTVLPFVYILVRYFKERTRIIYREVRKQVAMLNAAMAEDISGIKVIQLFNQYYNKCRQFARINQRHYKASMEQLKLFAIFRPLISISRNIAIGVILWYGGGQIIQNALTLGMLMAFIRYMERFFEPVNHLSEKFNILQAAMSGAERVFDLMARDPQDYRETLTEEIKLKGEIDFANVWLTYNHSNNKNEALNNSDKGSDNRQEIEFVLKDISFNVKKGEKIALVGHTGSGKTSIINLLGEMYPFQKGDIRLDGRSIKEYSINDLRSNIGIVQQDVFLFSGTIKDNIMMNNYRLTDEDIKRIGEYVNVNRFVDTLPNGYDEPVMERGATFSVGQRQLIAFARVLAYDPAIFILDEATSNIDTETELLIQDALRKVMKDRTSIIIAHRLSTIQHVDRIIVLHKGKIVEEGHHNELIANKNLYYDLYRLQYA